jgi:hypothetical protein
MELRTYRHCEFRGELWRRWGQANDSQAPPDRLGSGIDKDRPDYSVCSDEGEVGRIYQSRGGPERLGWFRSMIGATATL